MSKNQSIQIKTKQKSLQIIEGNDKLAQETIQELKELAQKPTTVGILEFLTGVTASVIDKPSNLVLSGGRLAQAFVTGEFYKQLYNEVQQFRKEGKMPDETLNTNAGRSIYVDFLNTIDSDASDNEKIEAYKTIFLKSFWVGTDEHTQVVIHEYFQVCKKLNSLELLMLKTVYLMYKNKEGSERGFDDWDIKISERLGIAKELITFSRRRNTQADQTPNSAIFQADYNGHTHGLSALGIAIGELLDKDSLEHD